MKQKTFSTLLLLLWIGGINVISKPNNHSAKIEEKTWIKAYDDLKFEAYYRLSDNVYQLRFVNKAPKSFTGFIKVNSVIEEIIPGVFAPKVSYEVMAELKIENFKSGDIFEKVIPSNGAAKLSFEFIED